MLILISELRIKNAVSRKRDDIEASVFQHLIPGHKVKKYSTFLKSSCNKREFIGFLAQQQMSED